MVDRRENERGGQTFLAQRLHDVVDGAEPRLKGLDDVVVPVLRALRDQAPGVGREEVVVVMEVEPLGIPLGVVRRQPNRDVLSRLLRLACLLHQVEAAGPHLLPHPCGSTRGAEGLAPVKMEPQIPVRHHPQVAFTHRDKNRHDGDGVWREVLELHTVVVVERPHEAAWGRAEAVPMKFSEGDHVPFRRSRLPVVRRRRDPLWPRRRSTRA